MNKKFYAFIALLATAFAGIMPALAQVGPVNDTLYMGAGYANEVYYSMSAGNKGALDRKQWDIAFRAYSRSASIITNDGANNNAIGLAGVELYTYPKAGISGWLTVDTAGMYSWKNMVNSTTDWEDGAFCRYQKGHPDYGWGKYNTVTHDVTGDSLFIIKLRDGSLRKLWIVRKYSTDNLYEFRYANIDGTHDTTVTLDCKPYSAKNFIGYSITTNKVVDFEPVVSTQWDLLFTKYMYTYPATTPEAGTLYPVTGVLSNYKTKVKKYAELVSGFPVIDPKTMDSTRSPIGWDWKYFDMNTNVYKIVDPLVYFVQDQSGILYKLTFKEFVGSSTGRIVLQKEVNTITGIDELEKSGFNAAVYPNPVNEVMNLVINPGKSRNALVSLYDLSGRNVLTRRYDMQPEDLSTLQIPVSGIPSGMYMLKIQAGSNVISRKVVINK